MDIYQVIGVVVVIYLACAGLAAHVWAVMHGQKRINHQLSQGRLVGYEAERLYQDTMHPERSVR